jgi:tRNA(adenine34) deaminase
MKNIFMEATYKEAKKAFKEDEVPVGCVIVKDDEIIARAHHRKVKKDCAVYHAEIECITKACKKLNNWNLKGCDIYITLEPCMMCTGAIVNSRLDRIFYGCKDPKGGALVSNIRFKRIRNLNHYPEIKCGIMESECSTILKEFFKNKRK